MTKDPGSHKLGMQQDMVQKAQSWSEAHQVSSLCTRLGFLIYKTGKGCNKCMQWSHIRSEEKTRRLMPLILAPPPTWVPMEKHRARTWASSAPPACTLCSHQLAPCPPLAQFLHP